MIQTLPLGHIHRDKLGRVIRLDDVVVWANGKYGRGLTLGIVAGSTEGTVRIARQDTGRMTNVNSDNLIVITHQAEENLRGNVGANRVYEVMREGVWD